MVSDHPEYATLVREAKDAFFGMYSELATKALAALPRFPEGLTWSYRGMNRAVSVLCFDPSKKEGEFSTLQIGNIKGNAEGDTSCAEKNGAIVAVSRRLVVAGMFFVGAPDPQNYNEGEVPEFLMPCERCCGFVPYIPWILLDGYYQSHNPQTGGSTRVTKIRDAFQLPEPRLHPEFLSLLDDRRQLNGAS